jgi:pyridoxal phosphate enzyme (YggS family)
MENSIAENIKLVTRQIEIAAKKSGRARQEIKLVVVTKGQSVENIAAVIQAGASILGENYPEETHRKLAEMGTNRSIVEWHMIGHLQSRKIKYILEDFSMIHSVDGFEIARDLGGKLQLIGKHMDALFEVNMSGEESKHGFPAWNQDSWPILADQFNQIQTEVSNLNFVGLMTMPPYAELPESSRQYFRKCRELCQFIQSRIGKKDFQQLSMGTSLDYMVAVEEGATFLRVGEAIMGKRVYN